MSSIDESGVRALESDLSRPQNKMMKIKVLMVSSSGGHWVQLMRLKPAFDGSSVTYMSTVSAPPPETDDAEYISVPDASMSSKIGLFFLAAHVLFHVARRRPDVIVTTGAAPGFFAIVAGRILGKKTIWIDSIANSEQLSLAGSKAGRWASIWLTQWPHLARPDGPKYIGSVI